MSQQRDFAAIGQRWSGWAKIVGTLIALAALLGFGGFFYNEVWQSKMLTYTILPSYDLGDQAFSGLVIENRGRVTLTGVQIVLSNLETPIEALNMPGAHEPVQVTSGGVGYREALIEMPRLSKGTSLSIYMLTSGVVTLEDQRTFLVSSKETIAVPSRREPQNAVYVGGPLALALLLVILAGPFLAGYYLRHLALHEIMSLGLERRSSSNETDRVHN